MWHNFGIDSGVDIPLIIVLIWVKIHEYFWKLSISIKYQLRRMFSYVNDPIKILNCEYVRI